MLTTYAEILATIKDNLDEIQNNPWPDDALREYADSEVPIYTNDIIDEWREMPSEYNDGGSDYAADDSGIVDLMRYDLYNYYSETFYRAYRDLTEGESN